MKRKNDDEMSERQAERVIETYENAMKNGEQWAHDVFLHRGTEKYEKNLQMLNQALEIKCMHTIIEPLRRQAGLPVRKRIR